MKTKDQGELTPGATHAPKLVIVGTVEIAAGRRDQLLPLLMAHKARCLKNEPGTLQFEIMVPHEDDTKLHLFEVYQNAAAFETHHNGPSVAQFRAEAAGIDRKISLTRCALVE
jgi:quinol monooxygenase YgiN